MLGNTDVTKSQNVAVTPSAAAFSANIDKCMRKVLKEATGEDISTLAMMKYFKPLMSWREEQNKGRQIGWE